MRFKNRFPYQRGVRTETTLRSKVHFRPRARSGRSALLLGLFLTLGSLAAGTVQIVKVTATQTQIVIKYKVTGPQPCVVSVTDENGGINPPLDVNPTLFLESNYDLGRTTANGFRWPTLVASDGVTRTVVLGGHDEIKQGADGKSYSTAFQVASPHLILFSCNEGFDTGTVNTSTANIPIGSYYPELPIPTPGSPLGGIPQPTIDWTDRTVKYIDPITGVLIQRVTGPADNFNSQNPVSLVKVFDPSNAWTNKDNAISTNNSGAMATTSTPNAPLHIAWDNRITPYCCQVEISDFIAHLYGSGVNGNEIAEISISLDSGQSSASGTIDVPFNKSAHNHDAPADYPTSFFNGWGIWNTAFGTYDLQNFSYSGVNASGSTVILPSLTAPGFNVDRKPGSKFTLTGCANGPDTTLTVASCDTFAQITTVETGLDLIDCTYQDWSAGLRVVMKNAGTLSLNVAMEDEWGQGDGSGSSGSNYVCDTQTLTDISIDCDGNFQNPPLTGYLCGFSSGVYLVQNNGRMCLQSNRYGPATHLLPMDSPWIDGHSLMETDYQQPSHLWKMSLDNKGDYTEFVPGTGHPPDKFNYVDITATAPPIDAQIIAAGGPAAKALSTGLWPPFGAEAVIGGNIQYRSTSAGQDSMCMLAWTDANNKLIRSMTAFDTYPLRWGGCHFSPNGVGEFSNANDANTPYKFNKSALLGGPFTMHILGIRKNGHFQSYTIPITAGSATNPVVLTSPNNDLDNLSSVNPTAGALITCEGGTERWAAVNAEFHAHKIDNNTFSLYTDVTHSFDGTTFGPLTGNVTCSMAPSLSNIYVSKVGGSSTARITADVTTPSPGYLTYFPSGKVYLKDSDPVNFSNLEQTKQYYVKATCDGCSPYQFDVYKDANCSVPASQTEIAAAANGYIDYAEACPDPEAVHLPGPLFYDSGFGSPRGPRKIRCVTIRTAGEPCSEYASPGEQASYPCPSDPNNVSKSSLQSIQPGDVIFDLEHAGNNHEYMLVLQKAQNREGQIDLTVERWYGDSPEWRVGNGRAQDYWAMQHSPGWTAWVIPPIPSAWLQYTTDNTWIPESPSYSGAHHDVSTGSLPGNLVLSSGYAPGSYNDLVDLPALTFFATPVMRTENSLPVWASDINDTMINGPKQSYPAHRQVFGQAPAAEQVWKEDWMAINPDYGNGGNYGDGSGIGRALTYIRGTSYDPNNETSIVYKITNPAPSGSLNIKLVNYLLHASPHWYFADKSGPQSLLTDADIGDYCLCYNAGECRPGSSPGDAFIAMRGVYDLGQCTVNTATLSPPCLYPLWPGAGWAVQVRQTPEGLDGKDVRRLTMGFALPMTHFSFQNWIASPDGKWGFFVTNPIQYRPAWQYYSGTAVFAMKLPPWPQLGEIDPVGQEKDRSTFVPYAATTDSTPGDALESAFGYGENSIKCQFCCTSRLETCWTSATATPAIPFVFDLDTRSPTSCGGSSCTVQIPAIPGRVLYYRIQHASGIFDDPEAVGIP